MIKFFHQLFRPNCSCNICAAPKCETCEVLRVQLDYERANNRQLINSLIAQVTPEKSVIAQTTNTPVNIGPTPWRVRQQMLEEEDRAAAKIKRDKELEQQANKLTTAELEKELGIEPLSQFNSTAS